MHLIDKLILAALILMLPIGFFISRMLIAEEEEATPAVDIAAIEQAIRQSVSQAQPEPVKIPEITIAVVSYASNSGTLTIAGKAPFPQATIWVNTVFLPLAETQTGVVTQTNATPTPAPVQKAEVYSVLPSSDGNFTFSYDIPRASRENLIELRFDQDASTKTIRFDPVTNKQIF